MNAHFGGRLYATVDPHAMLLLMRCPGKDYVVWDSWASIAFLKPGRGKH